MLLRMYHAPEPTVLMNFKRASTLLTSAMGLGSPSLDTAGVFPVYY